jgi:hypothetical protein
MTPLLIRDSDNEAATRRARRRGVPRPASRSGCNVENGYRFSLSGNLVWHHTTACEGGGGTAVQDGGDVYARGAHDTPVILSKSAGAPSGTFASQTAPAFGSNNVYTLDSGYLVAVDSSGSPDRWSFGDGTLVTAPVVVGGAVFVGSRPSAADG